MTSTIQIIAFYVVAVVLIVYSVYFASRKHFRISGLFVVFSFVSFILAQFSGKGLSAVIHGLTVEQYLCWGFGFLFLCLAIYFVHEKALAYGFAVSIIAVISCFCGFSSVQSFLKTQMLWMVTDTLKSYGDKLDNYQATVVDIQKRLSAKQEEFESNQMVLVMKMNDQKKELDTIQAKIREAETNIFGQQSDITNQYGRIFLLQSDLVSAQTNLDVQERKISDIESLVDTLFSNTEYENLSGSDTNKVAILNLGGVQQLIFKLEYAPVPNTVQVVAMGGGIFGQIPFLPQMGQAANLLMTRYVSGVDLKGATFSFRYIKDNRSTNLIHSMTITGTNSVSLDGFPLKF